MSFFERKVDKTEKESYNALLDHMILQQMFPSKTTNSNHNFLLFTKHVNFVVFK